MTDGPDQALSERFALQHDELPKPDFADVLRRASRISIRPEPRKHPRNYRLWGARPVLAAAVVVGVLAGAGVAVAAGLGAFEGTPAPPEITSALTIPKQIIADATKQGMAQAFPQADVSHAHGVIEIQTPDGPQDLWAAPNDQGGQCYFIDYANDPAGSSGGKPGSGGCFAPDAISSSEIVADGPEWAFDSSGSADHLWPRRGRRRDRQDRSPGRIDADRPGGRALLPRLYSQARGPRRCQTGESDGIRRDRDTGRGMDTSAVVNVSTDEQVTSPFAGDV